MSYFTKNVEFCKSASGISKRNSSTIDRKTLSFVLQCPIRSSLPTKVHFEVNQKFILQLLYVEKKERALYGIVENFLFSIEVE